MEFRLFHSGDPASADDGDLLSPRRIRFASEIPRIGLYGFDRAAQPIRLRGVVDEAAASFVSVHGAYRKGGHWYVPRRDPFPFGLGEHLPRMAQMTIIPEVPAMEHPSHWHARLENMMTRPSWSRLIADIWRRERVCFECGSIPPTPERLEGHETWEMDLNAEVPVRRLTSIRILCGPCMEMKHLGPASRRNVFNAAFSRLCAINRIGGAHGRQSEMSAYRMQIEGRHVAALDEGSDWRIDLSAFPGCEIALKEFLRLDVNGCVFHSGGVPGLVEFIGCDTFSERGGVIVMPRGRIV